jgi:hypothetical protein
MGREGVAGLSTWTQDECEWLLEHPYILIPKQTAPGTRSVGGWVGPRVGMDAVDKTQLSFSLPAIERCLGMWSESVWSMTGPATNFAEHSN